MRPERVAPAHGRATGEVVLHASGVTFSHGTTRILHGIDLEVRAGLVLGLLGPNGAGKSTLVGVLAGDLDPESGEVFLAGEDVARTPHRELARRRAVMPQQSAFPFSYLVRDVVSMGRLPWPSDPVADERIVTAAMKRTEVAHLEDRDVTRLSGGERARVTFARVLAQCAPVVFLDEPTAALDIGHQEATMATCRDLAREGCAVLAVMHDLQLAAAHCDLLALMDAGRIVALGAPEEVLTSSRLSEVYGWPIRVVRLDDGTLVVLPGNGGEERRADA